MELTRKQAIDLSIKKWEWIVENKGQDMGLTIAIPELDGIKGSCPLCDKYFYTCSSKLECCFKCPLRSRFNSEYDGTESGCCQEYHIYNIWHNNKTKENAQAVLGLIKSVK